MLKTIIFSLLLATLAIGQTVDNPVSSLQEAKDLLLSIQKQKAQLQDEVNQFNANIDNIRKILVDSVKEDLKWTGVGLGNRWKIQEEGTNSYEALVFRDMTSTNSGVDRRYAMYKERYTDK